MDKVMSPIQSTLVIGIYPKYSKATRPINERLAEFACGRIGPEWSKARIFLSQRSIRQTDRHERIQPDREIHVGFKQEDMQAGRQTDWQIDRLTGWQIDRLTDWLIDELIDWLTDWLTDWWMDRWINQLIDWLRLKDRQSVSAHDMDWHDSDNNKYKRDTSELCKR